MTTSEHVYIEHFNIPHVGMYEISICGQHPQKFTPWEGGCAIHKPFDDINQARKYIFDHAVEGIQRDLQRFRTKILWLTEVAAVLEDDVFNLAQYKDKDKDKG
jgi:hypothetical protein